jgi:hypothetical protein
MGPSSFLMWAWYHELERNSRSFLYLDFCMTNCSKKVMLSTIQHTTKTKSRGIRGLFVKEEALYTSLGNPSQRKSKLVGGGRGRIFLDFSFVPNMFSSRSQWVLTRFPMCSPRVFSVAFFPCSQCVPSYVFPSRSQWVPIKFPICSPTLFSVATSLLSHVLWLQNRTF